MKKFFIVGNPVLNNTKLEEFLYENKNFSIKSNSSNEVYFNNTFVGIMTSRSRTSKGWKISLSYLFVSGAIATDEIEVKMV